MLTEKKRTAECSSLILFFDYFVFIIRIIEGTLEISTLKEPIELIFVQIGKTGVAFIILIIVIVCTIVANHSG